MTHSFTDTYWIAICLLRFLLEGACGWNSDSGPAELPKNPPETVSEMKNVLCVHSVHWILHNLLVDLACVFHTQLAFAESPEVLQQETQTKPKWTFWLFWEDTFTFSDSWV